MQKNYVLDTNVLIHDPQSIFQFEDNNLYIPIYVLEELDKIKGEQSLRGRNSREVCRILEEFRVTQELEIKNVDIPSGGKLTVFVPEGRKTIDVALDKNCMDNAILQCAKEISEQNENTILVTMDVNLRLRSHSIGIRAASYESESVDPAKMISGHREIDASMDEVQTLYRAGSVALEDDEEDPFYHNLCATLNTPDGRTVLARYSKGDGKFFPVKLPKEGVMGIKPRNREQQFAMDMLLDDDVQLISLVGMAGTGKTLLAIAAGIQKIMEEETYNRILVSRPVVPMGKDLGYLPGTVEEKMAPWMQPIIDNLELLMMMGGGKRRFGMNHEQMFDEDIIRIEPITYIRGRSLPHQFIIIDEAQNLSPHEMKTIITRCGEGSKIILTGDPDQIDNPYMDKGSCGLSMVVEKLHDKPMVGHLTLKKGERSPLANLAATCM